MLSPELLRELDLLIEDELIEDEDQDHEFTGQSDPIDCGPEKAQNSSPIRSAGSSIMSEVIRENIELKKQLDADRRIADFSRKVFGPIAAIFHIFSIAGLLCWAALFAKVGCEVIKLVMLIINIIY